MEEKGLKNKTYHYINIEYRTGGVHLRTKEYLFDRLVRAMSYIEYNGLNESFFEYQDELEKELENNG